MSVNPNFKSTAMNTTSSHLCRFAPLIPTALTASALTPAALALLVPLALLALLAAPKPALAAPVSYTFSTRIDTSTSPLNGQAFGGSFSFDNSTGQPGLGSETWYALSSFSFNFPGGPFGLPSLTYGDAVFDGASFKGLDVGATTFAMLPASGQNAAFFAFDTGSDRGNGSLSFSLLPTSVPEPGSLLLVGVALALLGRVRGYGWRSSPH